MTIAPPEALQPFRHVALLYEGPGQFTKAASAFVQEGLDLREPVLVAVPTARLDLLRRAFRGVGRHRVRFEPMEVMGRNPAWIIPAWQDFVTAHGGAPARGIGEPIWRGRSADELVECDRHESLLNVAFGDAAGFTLLCPYDTGALDAETIDGAHRNHPHVNGHTGEHRSPAYRAEVPASMDEPLPAPPGDAARLPFRLGSVADVRRVVVEIARSAGHAEARALDLAIALNEAMINSVRHGGGRGEVVVWTASNRLLCEVRDGGRISDPLAGRRRPPTDAPGGRGLWLMHQLSDLVQIRSVPGGQVIRFHLTG